MSEEFEDRDRDKELDVDKYKARLDEVYTLKVNDIRKRDDELARVRYAYVIDVPRVVA